jgi:membrane-associated phospholipid phosphatase
MNIKPLSIDYIGIIGPVILTCTSIFLLVDKPLFLWIYIGGNFINAVINFILKILFKDPRPSENSELVQLVLNNGRAVDINKYGMPSRHSQSVAFSTIFIYLVLKNMYIVYFYLIISMITMFQRYKTKKHTIFQIVIGFIVGLIIGYLFFIIAKNMLKGKICSKKDDNCFL